MVDDVHGFLECQDLLTKGAVLVGHSMGGKVAALACLKYPEMVKGAVIMDIAPVAYSVVDQVGSQFAHFQSIQGLMFYCL